MGHDALDTPAEPRARPAPGRWTRRLGLATLGALAALLAAEAVLAWTDWVEPIVPTYPGEHENRTSKAFQPDPVLGWTMRPGYTLARPTLGRTVTYQADDEGFRVPEEGRVRECTRTIALVGDSFLWGLGVSWEESLAGRLEEALPSVCVRNYGMPGFGVDQMALALEEHALKQVPDLVVVGVFPPDLDRSHHAYRLVEGFNKPCFLLDGDELRLRTPADTPWGPWRWLRSHSRLLAVLHRFERWIGRRFAVGSWWELNAALLDRMQESARRAGVPIVFVHVPKRPWVPCPALGIHLEARGAAYVDLQALPVQDPGELYFPDGHFDPEGHQLLADAVLAWIRSARVDLD